MIMTEDVTRRFSALVKDFADKHRLFVRFDHEYGEKQTKLWFGAVVSHLVPYWVDWTKVSTISEAAAYIFADAIREFDLDKTLRYKFNAFTEEQKNDKFDIKDVIFNGPATIVLWQDGTKTVVKCQGDDFYSRETGLALCIAKKALGNQGNFNNVFRKWVPEETESPMPFSNFAEIFRGIFGQ